MSRGVVQRAASKPDTKDQEAALKQEIAIFNIPNFHCISPHLATVPQPVHCADLSLTTVESHFGQKIVDLNLQEERRLVRVAQFAASPAVALWNGQSDRQLHCHSLQFIKVLKSQLAKAGSDSFTIDHESCSFKDSRRASCDVAKTN